ncbi:MAG: membrane protein insertase YidC [bacterium]
MDFDKKTVLAFLIIGLILVFTQTNLYKKWAFPNMGKETTPAVQPAPQDLDLNKRSQSSEAEEPEPPAPEKNQEVVAAPEESIEEATGGKYSELVGPGETVSIVTDLYHAEFSTQGATLRSWTLNRYLDADSQYVQLVGGDGQGNFALLLPTFEDTIDTSPFVFSVDKKRVVLSEKHPIDEVEFTLDLGPGKAIVKKFTFYYDQYSIDFDVRFRNIDEVEGFSYFVTWRSGLESTEPDFKDDMSHANIYALQGGDVEKFDVKNKFKRKDWDNPTDWIAIRTKYFTTVLIPKSDKAQAVWNLYGELVPGGEGLVWKKYGYDLQMPFYEQAKSSGRFIVYLGPLDYDILKSYHVGLEKMMDFGWLIFRPFAKFVLWSFKALSKVIPNYGFVIIIFSILIKLGLFPLTRKSYKSMKAMQALQPLMQEINEKYKEDPQKKQAALMNLYKEHGVNPLGGCIPMLLQMPLLYGLFSVFRSTIELRGAPFIWWIKDLSRPDTIATLPFTLPLYGNTVNVLPLFMGITMFIQQKISVTDPKQKAMVYFMPIFFTLLFNSFPSGLNLYYALFNLFTILQEKLLPYTPPGPEALKKGKLSAKKNSKLTKYEKWKKLKRS